MFMTQLLADDTPFSMSADTFHEEFVTNVVGPTLVSQTFLPLVEKSQRKTIVNVSSSLGSIGSVTNPRYSYFAHYTSYSITKTALNMLVCLRCSCGQSKIGALTNLNILYPADI